MEENLHWADEKEVIKTNKPLKLVLFIMKFIPGFLVRALVYPISFFYLIFTPRARTEAIRYQKQLKEYTNGEFPKKISAYKQLLSFSLSIVEKFEGWLGSVKLSRMQFQDDSINEMLEGLKNSQGAMVLTAHFGNMELMRSIADVPVYVVMDLKVGQQFTNTLKSINPKAAINIVDSNNIGPDTIVYLMSAIESGALVVSTGDRTSANNRDKVIKCPFLGKEASFPYGMYMMLSLMKLPVYYMFNFRTKFSIFNPKYNIHVEKSNVDFNCGRSERENRINECCKEFVTKLEKFCKMYPYQWYNYFNFWK